MRYLLVFFCFLTFLPANEDFQMADVQLSRLSKLNAPEMREFPGGIEMAISTNQPESQKHVLQGLNLIHGGWDFEAYRHFLAAIEKDPDCLMAFFGMAFATQGDGDEFTKARITAIDRSLALAQAGAGTPLERGYVHGLHTLVSKGPQQAAEAFASVAAKFPNDPQIRLFEAYFLRSGFDESGTPSAGQELAQKKINDLLAKNPESLLFRNAWLVIRAENPFPAENDVAMARELAAAMPDFPPIHHLLGHYEWRSGNFSNASAVFSKTSDLYHAWMKKSELGIVDCPEWIRSESYRAVALSSAGKLDDAIQIASALQKLAIPEKEIGSAGARMIAWEGRTLAARLYHRFADKPSIQNALDSLPKPQEVNRLMKSTKAGTLYQALTLYFEGMKSVTGGDFKRAEEISQLMNLHGNQMTAQRKEAIQLGEISHFARAFRGLEIITAELKGNTVQRKEKGKSTAFNWYAGAVDRQNPASRMMPPLFLLPMQIKVGQYFHQLKEYDDALEAYEDGLKRWPNDLLLLDAQRMTLVAKGDAAAALEVRLKIEAIKAKK